MQEMIQKLIDDLPNIIQEHWLKALGTLAFALITSYWVIFTAWRKWRTRQDTGLIHISQNTIEIRPANNGDKEPWLILDVHREDKLSKCVENPIPRYAIEKAAKKTTADQPFLEFPEADRWYILNIVRLAIAEQFAQGTAAKMAKDAKVETVQCVFAMTYERYPGMRQGKIRVMLIREEDLLEFDKYEGKLKFESLSHSDREVTLLAMRKDFKKGKLSRYCMDVRIDIQL